MWPLVNGVAMANRDKVVFCLGSDGSQQEGNDAEAARLAVAKNLNVKLLIDDNDVTIAGHPSEYLKGYEVGKTLEGHGLKVIRADGENIDELWSAVAQLVTYDGPAALISKRKMAPGVKGLEGSPHGHDVVSLKVACEYLEGQGYPSKLSEQLNAIKPGSNPYLFIGSTKEKEAGRVQFGTSVSKVLDKLSKEEAAKKVMVIDSKLADISISKSAQLIFLQAISRAQPVSKSFIKNIQRCSFPQVSWNVVIFPPLPVSVSTRINTVSSPHSPLSLRCVSPKSPWLVLTTATSFVISRIAVSMRSLIIPAISGERSASFLYLLYSANGAR
jgi:hypothetical protein